MTGENSRIMMKWLTNTAIASVWLVLRPACLCTANPGSKSPTFRRWFAVELSEENRQAFFIQKGFAHGFQTLVDGSEVLYQMSEFYAPSSARGFRWNDPMFGIEWPEPVRVISERDRSYPDFAVTGPQVA